ncbi:aminotransferase class I/II-fold pyridoxal phosphate-dependent enzyme [Candidatus Pelagibacter sp.]|nr:aminotransferase class I/II-fold pyridoxal phosphate-dependent enzyme [Candidatus Pelagibacter sp.]
MIKKDNFSHPLMHNNFSSKDFIAVKKFLKSNNVLTQNKKVLEFEKNWSKWLGVKYSVFVNSGSSANLISISVLKILKNKGGEIIVPPLTWVSDIVSILFNNFKPVFVDVNLKNLSANEDEIIKKITKKTKAIFLTHALGFNGLSDKILKICKTKKITLIEDVCESHGATFEGKKLGNFGLISNFSFYYAHHMSTIEGGMICTNDKKIYEICRMLRSHGMLREANNSKYEAKLIKKNKDLSPKFIFMYPGFNMRNNEIGAVIGLTQLKRLNKNNNLRKINFKTFLHYLDKDKYFKEFDSKGSCNYAFPLLLKIRNLNNRYKLEKTLTKNNIEFRRGGPGGGNQLRQPYLKNIIKKKINYKNYPNVEIIHSYGYYIGNYPSLSKKKIIKICKILNEIDYK